MLGAEDDEAAAFEALEHDATQHGTRAAARRGDDYNVLTSFDLDDGTDDGDRPARRTATRGWRRHVALVGLLAVALVALVVATTVAALAHGRWLEDQLAPTPSPTPTPTPTPSGTMPALVLLSIDGLHSDYLTRALTPHLASLAARGVQAAQMQPVFPSKTFPNQYSLVTGLYPESHGIVSNVFYDPVLNASFVYSRPQDAQDARWWGGEPIWNTALKAGRRAACLFWPGSEAPIQGLRPTTYLSYSTQATGLSNTARMQLVLDQLNQTVSERPAVVAAYMSSVDSVGHSYGTTAPQLDDALADVDAAVGVLLRGIDALGLDDAVDVVVVSDHGMVDVDAERVVYLDDYIALADVAVIELGPTTSLFVDTAALRDAVFMQLAAAAATGTAHFQPFRRDLGEVPARFHYTYNARIAPILLLLDEGWSISVRGYAQGLRGNHGYDNALASMRAVFLAAGPHFRRGAVVRETFAAVEVYAVLARVLGLAPAPNNGTWPSPLADVLVGV